jgi:hypothetical protein
VISPITIQDRCQKIWKEFLLFCITNDPKEFFPIELTRISKVKSKDILTRFSEYLKEIDDLRLNSDEVAPLGYNVVWLEHTFQKVGNQRIPDKVFVTSLESYLFITKKSFEFEIFENTLNIIKEKLPILIDWVAKDPMRITKDIDWNKTIKVCNYFILNPKPNMYLRQLPIEVHTKFISDHETHFRSLLDFLIPDVVNFEGKRFEERYNLLFDEALIRIRFLDPKISPFKEITYLTFTRSELKHYSPTCTSIFVVENKMNFLTLPFIENSISIWSGGGFSISLIQYIDWIKEKTIFYWGDLDEHGFEILNQFKTYFPKTRSILMEKNLLQQFNMYVTEGKISKALRLPALDSREKEIFEFIKENNIRLEQEKIPQDFVERYLYNLVHNN